MAKSREKHITRTALGTLAVVVGLLCLAGAVFVFGLGQTVRLSKPDTEVLSVTAAGAACGLAIAGGLCFVAAAIAELAAGLHWLAGRGGGPVEPDSGADGGSIQRFQS